MILYYALIFLLSISLFLSMFFIFRKFPNKKPLVLKIVSVVLLGVASARYLLKEMALLKTRGLNVFSPFGDNVGATIVGTLLIWFTFATIFFVVLASFFDNKVIKNFLKFFGLPVLILDLILLKTYYTASYGYETVNSFGVSGALMSVELAISLAYIVEEYFKKDYFKLDKKEVITLLIALPFILLAIMPSYTIQVLFGYTSDPNIKIKGFTFEHRLMLYLSVIIPTILYFIFKNKDEKTKRFMLVYLSMATLWTYLVNYQWVDVTNPLNWPLHLCNTAMFIIPLCLVFKLDKLFYFTFFINVMGAFLAMAMPNTDSNALANSTMRFWINHFCAFFMPVLIVMLGIFKRPKIKQWIYSMVAFAIYFVSILFINAWFSNYGSVDYFFLNSDFVVNKLGDWAKHTRDLVVSFKINDLTFTFYPVYQALFFGVYTVISVIMWFLYEQLFQIVDLENDREERNRAYKQMREELAFLLEGRSEDEPMSGNGEPCLELKGFSKKYGTSKYYSVKDASLKVNSGEIFGFLGPNGAGKSTTIKSIVGIQTISEGSIEVCGYDVEKQSVQAKKQIGFVPDHYALYENLTGREYINYIADLYGVSKEDRDYRINKYVTNFALENAFDSQMKTYSHGMKQKITIMAALVHNPKVWILDEPLTGLDPTSIYQVKESIKEHAKEGNIVFFSSHIIDVVEKLCDRIAIIKKGTILKDVTIKELQDKHIDLEEFYLETINDDLIKQYEGFPRDKEYLKENKEEIKKETSTSSSKKAVRKTTSTSSKTATKTKKTTASKTGVEVKKATPKKTLKTTVTSRGTTKKTVAKKTTKKASGEE